MPIPPFQAVIAGGGPAALEAALALRALAPDVEVELIAPDPAFVYRPLTVVEPFGRTRVRRYPLDLLGEEGVTVTRDAVARVDVAGRRVHTDGRLSRPFDGLIVATGAQRRRAVPRVMTFEGPAYVEAVHGLLQDVEAGFTRSVAFLAPPGAGWTLPLYELALQLAHAAEEASVHPRLTVATHERRPLELLGPEASDLAERLLAEARIAVVPFAGAPAAERSIALPVPTGRHFPGLPADPDGFLPVDAQFRVPGAERVWAAGDGTALAVRQGGLATQQAEVAARSLAGLAGAPVEPTAYAPILRAMLVTGRGAWWLRRRLDGDEPTEVAAKPMWWPPSKFAGDRLAPWLDALDVRLGADRFERRLGTTEVRR